jgi:hypothetical protein
LDLGFFSFWQYIICEAGFFFLHSRQMNCGSLCFFLAWTFIEVFLILSLKQLGHFNILPLLFDECISMRTVVQDSRLVAIRESYQPSFFGEFRSGNSTSVHSAFVSIWARPTAFYFDVNRTFHFSPPMNGQNFGMGT